MFQPQRPFDEVYCWYVMRFFALFELVKQKKPDFMVKELDFYLLSL